MKTLQNLTRAIALLSLFVTVSFSQSTDTFRGYRAGYYKGRAFNSTANARGNAGFELYDLNRENGHVRAYFIASDGLEGEAWLTGSITSNGELDLSGTLESFRMEVRGHLASNGSITAEYRLEGTNPQRGNFEVSFVEAIRADMADDRSFRSSAVSSLIGAWEVGGALPAQRNPITGMSVGISFVDVHRLEFFPDGSFKHLWSHRHCDGPSCCRDQAMLETGSYAFDGARLTLTVTGGNLINTDACNPKMNGHTDVKHGTFIYAASMKEGLDGSQLCLQQTGQQTATCYRKQ